MPYNNEDATNKIPLKSASGLDNDEEKNGGEMILDIAEAAAEARREQMRANLLKWMKKLTIVLICFIGIALISYVIISLCFSDDNNNNSTQNSTSFSDSNTNNATNLAATTLGFGNRVANSTIITEKTTTPVTPASIETTTEQPKQTEPAAANVAAKPAATPFQDIHIADKNFTSKLGVYKQAAVCSDREICSQIGSNLLEQGGSAVDSAIATLLCNGIVSMQSLGIGGGMLMNVYIKEDQRAYSIDAREVAPYAATADMFDNNATLSLHGGLAIAVPGELMGYYRAHKRFGKLPWKTLIEPSIKLCNEGYYLSQHQRFAFENKRGRLKDNTTLLNVFVNATTGEVHPVGTKLKPQKQLCDTYALLAKNGPLDFYNGTLAKLVAADLKDLGSKVNLYDLQTYTADSVHSITMQLGDNVLYAVPPISSGSVVAHILSILEKFNLTSSDLVGEKNEAKTIHRIAEAMKFGYAKRWELGDSRFNDVRELVSKLNSPDYGMEIQAKINDSQVLKTIADYGAQYAGADDMGTSHTVVLAPNGDAVSVTSSINDYFGSGRVGPRTGIIFNSAMDDFSVAGQTNLFALPPAPSNFIDGHKRPMSSMSPMILADQNGNIRMLLGAAGGSKIISAVVEVAARVLWLGQDIKAAIDAPRFHDQLIPNVLQYQDKTFSEEIIKLLRAKGHDVQPYKDIGSVVCGIVRNETAIYANADYRKRGGTAGY